MFKRYDKSDISIGELYELISKSDEKDKINLYAYKLFMLLSYLEKHDEALEVSKMITDSKVNKVILLYLLYLEKDYERVYLNSGIVADLDIDFIDNHHKHLAAYFRAIHHADKEEYDAAAKLLLDTINACETDEILLDIAILEFINITKKCKNKDFFYDFYASYYTRNRDNFPPKIVSLVENANNNINKISFSIDEVMDLYAKYIDGSNSFREFFYGSSKELEKIVDFDIAYLFIKDNENIDTYEYKKDLVYDRYYRAYEVTNTMYNKIMESKQPVIKRLNDDSIKDDIVLFKNNKDTYDSFIALPIINNDEVIAVFAVSSNHYDITESTKLLERYTNLLKFRIINMLNNHTARVNKQIVEVLDKLTDGYFIEKKAKIKLSLRAKDVLGVNSDEIHISELINNVKPIYASKLNKALSRDEDRTTVEIVTKDKRILTIESSVINLKNRDSIRVGLIRDLTTDRSQLNHYENLAYIDSLTKLPNYNSLMDAFKQIEDGEQVTFINFDINKFKLINDTYGHDVGDTALIFFGTALIHTFKPLNGQVFRKSGDEFIVILDKTVTREQKIAALANLTEYLKHKKNYPGDLPIQVDYSAGIASTRATKKDKETLFKFADLAMYEAKTNTNRRRYVFFDEVHLKQYKLELEKVSHVKEAIKNDTLEISYKDIICTDRTIHAYSVNIGIPNIELYDESIIELSIKNELLYKLGTSIIKKVFSEQRAFINQTHQERNVHIPISSDNLTTYMFYKYVNEKTKEYNISPDTITFVVRNLKNTGDIENIVERLNQYVKDGFNLSFDFNYADYPNPNYFNLVDFKYYCIADDVLNSLKKSESRRDIYNKSVFSTLKQLNVEAIVDDIDINKEYKFLKENGIKYFTQYGRSGNKLLKEVIAEVKQRGLGNE